MYRRIYVIECYSIYHGPGPECSFYVSQCKIALQFHVALKFAEASLNLFNIFNLIYIIL
jgi:hypothetical protein